MRDGEFARLEELGERVVPYVVVFAVVVGSFKSILLVGGWVGGTGGVGTEGEADVEPDGWDLGIVG